MRRPRRGQNAESAYSDCVSVWNMIFFFYVFSFAFVVVVFLAFFSLFKAA